MRHPKAHWGVRQVSCSGHGHRLGSPYLNALESVSDQEKWTLQHMRAAEDYARGVVRDIGVESYLIDSAYTAEEESQAALGAGGYQVVECDSVPRYTIDD